MFPLVMMGPLFAIAGIAAIGLPLWMHLYQRVASRRVLISSLRLAPEVPQVARSRRRIQYWLLFLLRALGVVLLGMAFARPGLDEGEQRPQGGRETVVFVLDRSGSMTMQSPEGASAWEETLAQLNNRLDEMHPQSRVRLFCYPPTETTEDWVSPSAMRKVVDGLTLSLNEGRPLDALQAANEALARFRSDMPESLEVIGDLQQQGWEEIDTLMLPEELSVRVSQTGDPDAANHGLALQVRGRDQLRRGAIVSPGGVPLVVADRTGENRETAEQEFPLPDKVLELPYRAAAEGWVSREISFNQTSDGLKDDDKLFDSFYVSSEIPVYLLEPQPEREVFLQTTFFLHQALRPTVGEAAADSRFLPQIVPVSEAVETLRGLDNREAVVVIPALESWPSELPTAVEEFVRQGGGAVFFAGPEIQSQLYASDWENLLPALPGEVLSIERSLALAPIGETHPIWGGMTVDMRRRLRKAPLKQRFALTVVEGAEATAHYADDVPLAVERSVGGGRTLFVNTSPDRAWGDWPTDGALFVPTIHMLTSSAVTSTAQLLRNSPGAGIVGVPFDVRVHPQWSGVPLRVEDLELRADEQGWVRDLQFDQPGLYDIQSKDGDYVRPVAVNFPPEESQRMLFHPTVLQRQLQARRRTEGVDGDAPTISLASESDWWRWILIALAIVWLAEPWLAFRPSSEPDRKGVES
jgi:hypothetical protein